MAISSGNPRFNRPPTSLYSPSTFSRTTTKSASSAARRETLHTLEHPDRAQVDVLAKRAPDQDKQAHRETWSGTPGQPTAPSRIASNPRSVSIPSAGIIAPSRS